MKCFFGHKLGPIEGNYQCCINCGKAVLIELRAPCDDGHLFGPPSGDYQRCTKCGKTELIPTKNPCEYGHNWKTEASLGYTGSNVYGGNSWRDYQLSQVCQGCHARRTVWQFGH